MAASNIPSLGRFSSQMLTYLGTQRTVQIQNGVPTNTFQYATGPTTFPNPSSYLQAELGAGVVGNFAPDVYDSTVCYFLVRGASLVYAQTMTALVIDMALMTSQTPQALLESTNFSGLTGFSDNSYLAMNNLRDPGNQLATVTSVDNKYSFQANQIRS